MVFRKFEKLGIETSLLGFGCMRFPLNSDGSIDEDESERMLDIAYQQGVNYFDTAYVYHEGNSEIFTGKALDKYDRSSYYLATKLPCWEVEADADAERLFNEQLRKLHKDYIDFYLLHSLNRVSFDKMVRLGVLDLMDRLKAEGKIKFLGFSFHDEFDAFDYILKFREWDFCQIQLNYMDTELQAGIKGYELAEKLGVPVIVMEPVKGGSLAKLPSNALQYFVEIDREKTPTSWALRWVASLSNVKVILSGMSDVNQVADNLNTLGKFKSLNTIEQKAINKVAEVLKNKVKNGCTGCSYCMPCPAGVDIPRNFSLWNDYGRYANIGDSRWQWNFNFDEQQKAKNCVECGQCEAVCPQKLSIIQDLKKVQLELDALSNAIILL